MVEKLAALTFGKAMIIGLVLTGVYYFYYDNGDKLNADLTKIKTDINKNRTELASIQKAIEAAKKYEVTKAQLGEEIDSIAKAIPADITSTELMLTLSNEAKTVGVQINKLNSLKANPAVSSNNKDAEPIFYEPISVDMEITGNFNQVMSFMANLTRLDKIITVNDLKLSSEKSKTKGDLNPDIKLKTTINAYKYVSPPTDQLKEKDGKERKKK